jgi:membrane protein DedA with SNARE-associated domain
VVAIVSAAFLISYTLNYWVGKYGWYRILVKFGLGKALEESKDKVRDKGIFNTILFTYWEPNLASITATAAGILDVPLGKFTISSLIGLTLWNIFWGILVYSLGDAALKIMGVKWVLAILVGWCAVLFIKTWWGGRRKAEAR